MKIVQASDVTPYSRNARTHSDAQITQITNSIRAFGFTNPLLIDDQNVLIAGHGRLAAARQLGMAQLPAIVLEGLSDADKQALRIADNKIALNSGWDDALLRTELADLRDVGFDMSLTGFGEMETDQLFAPDVDPNAEWEGMPEFEQQDRMAFRTVKVHFRDAAAVADFARLIGQTFTDQTKWTWFPQEERTDNTTVRYAREPEFPDLHPV